MNPGSIPGEREREREVPTTKGPTKAIDFVSTVEGDMLATRKGLRSQSRPWVTSILASVKLAG